MDATVQPGQAHDDRAEQLDALRAVIDWLAAHPAASTSIYANRILHPVDDRDSLVAAARAIGGRWDKSDDSWYFHLTQQIAPGWTYQLYVARDAVCERVKVGEREVQVPDPELVAELPTVVTTEPVFEWKCPPSLLAEVAA